MLAASIVPLPTVLVRSPAEPDIRWFGPYCCVVHGEGVASVFVGGVLVGRFSEEEARTQINKFSREGRIYERRPGFWAKA